MTPLPAETITAIGLPMALGLGLLYGLGPCLISCLPYLGPVFLASDGGMRQSWRIMLPLSLGRLTVYGSFGAVSGWWGSRFVDGAADWTTHLVIGLGGLLVGGALLLRRQRPRACVAPAGGTHLLRPLARSPDSLPFGLYLMGLGMALTPCAPQGVVLVSAAASGSALSGGTLGLAFGMGAIGGPALIYGTAVAYLGQELRQQLGRWLGRLEWLSGSLLLLVGGTQLLAAARLLRAAV